MLKGLCMILIGLSCLIYILDDMHLINFSLKTMDLSMIANKIYHIIGEIRSLFG